MSRENHHKNAKKEPFKPIKSSGSINYIFMIIALFGILGIGLVLFSNHGNTMPNFTAVVNQDTLPGIQVGEPPWQAELNHLRERLGIIGLPALQEEGQALHIHQHLEIFIHGKSVPVPPGIGFNPHERFISPIHTHDSDGVIHIESPSVQTFTLGQFFDIWGVRFSSKCIGSYCKDQKNALKVFINGVAREGDPGSIVLADHQVIVLTYGMPDELPNPIPSQYQFPPGT